MLSENLPLEIKHFSSLVELLFTRKRDNPSQIAYRFLRESDSDEEIATYEDLFYRASHLAGMLRRAGAKGERALILCPPGIDYLCAFFGCLLAESIAVPAYPPRPDRSLRRLRNLATDSGAKFAFTAAKRAFDIRDLLQVDLSVIPATECTEVEPFVGAPGLDQIAMLQYTSGSADTVKGVILTHGNLLANQRMIQGALRHSKSSVFITWLPLFHDMGLIGTILQPLYCGIPCVFMSPMSFLKNPVRWLRSISHYRGTTSGGPNFAYDLCARRITREEKIGLDLSSWDVAFNGAEPIRKQTLQRFEEAFGDYGFSPRAFYPCYGLAEASLIVTGGKKLAGGISNDRGQIDCGRALTGTDVLIVHPETGLPLVDGQEGEIWIRGRSIGAGYWNKPLETAQTFNATLANGQGGFLRTGDLGIIENEKLFVSGRLRDLIVIRGVNYYPQDIEASAQEAGGDFKYATAAAFAVDEDDEQRLVVLLENPKRTNPEHYTKLIAAIRKNILQDHGLECSIVVLVGSRTLPKTTSGKVKRGTCLEDFLNGRLQELARSTMAEPAYSDSIETADARQWLLAEVASYLGLPEAAIPSDEPLIRLGLDSVGAMSIMHYFKNRFGLSVPISVFFDGASIDLVASQIQAWPRPAKVIPTSEPMSAFAPPNSMQKAIAFFEQAFPANHAYLIERCCELSIELEPETIRYACQTLRLRHPALSMPKSDLDHGYGEAHLPGLNGFSVEPNQRLLTFSVHHSVADLWSMRLLMEEFLLLCQGLPLAETGREGWNGQGIEEQAWLESEEAEGQLDYWKCQMKDLPARLNLPFSKPRPLGFDYKASRTSFTLSNPLSASIHELARSLDTTLFVILLGAWKILLSKFSGRTDLIVGSPVANRSAEETQRVGCLVNTLPLRSQIHLDDTVEGFYSRLHKTVGGAVSNQKFPFSELVARLQPLRDELMSPLFDVMFAYESVPRLSQQGWSSLALGLDGTSIVVKGLSVKPLNTEPSHTHCDLLLSMVPCGNGFLATLTFGSDLFQVRDIQKLVDGYREVLERTIAHPTASLSQIICPAPRFSKRRVAQTWRLLPKRIEQLAQNSPQAIAAICEQERLSYSELNARANQLAHRLIELGARPEQVVGVCLPRSVDLIVAILAVFKSGAAYCPLDPKHPALRLIQTIRCADLRILITDKDELGSILGIPWVPVRQDEMPSHDLGQTIEPQGLAYLISTSGSTGEPKLVEVAHKSLSNCLIHLEVELEFTQADRFLATTKPTFDISLVEMLMPLSLGATVVIANAYLLFDPRKLDQVILNEHISVMQATPTIWNSLVANGWQGHPDLNIWSGGEALTQSLAGQLLVRGASVWNLYGPTEATIWATFHRVGWSDIRDERHMPIGRPLPGVEVSVEGDPPEIVIRGIALARGYHRDPRATSAHFLPSPDGRLYRTGDQGWIGDNQTIYCGRRLDSQLKIGGVRIEPGEIETYLLRHPQIRNAAVIGQATPGGFAELIAVVQLCAPGAVRPDLSSFLRLSLPEDLIPSSFHFVEEMPLTSNGKLDRRFNLPTTSVTPAAAPIFTDMEKSIKAVWASVLGISNPPLDASFFDLGGHSLMLTTLRTQLNEQLGLEASIQDLFRYPSIRAFTDFVAHGHLQRVGQRDGRAVLAQRRSAVSEGSA